MAVKRGADAVRTITPSEEAALRKSRNQVARSSSVAQPPTADPASTAAVTKATSIDDLPALADVLPALALRIRDITAQMTALEAEKKEKAGEIKALLEAVGCNNVAGDTWIANRTQGSSVKIKPELLLAHGVSMKVIEDSTETNKYWYVEVRGRKPQGE